MTKLVFGVDVAPEIKGETMAYIARGACGHIVVVQTDTRRESLTDFVAAGLDGLTLERVAIQQVHDEGICGCPKPEQTEMDW